MIMKSLADLLKGRETAKDATPKRPSGRTNPTWLLAAEIALKTQTVPNRWLRVAKADPNACRRALVAIAELSPRNKAAYFTKLIQVYGKKT